MATQPPECSLHGVQAAQVLFVDCTVCSNTQTQIRFFILSFVLAKFALANKKAPQALRPFS
eukprot:scaffold84533_cov24-Tisochrysis_lutea.AAC.2